MYNLRTGWGWMDSRFTPEEKFRSTHWIRWLGEPQSRSGHFAERKKFSLSKFLRGPTSSVVAISTALSLLSEIRQRYHCNCCSVWAWNVVRCTKGGTSTVESKVLGIIFEAKGKEMAVRFSAAWIMTKLRAGRSLSWLRFEQRTSEVHIRRVKVWNHIVQTTKVYNF